MLIRGFYFIADAALSKAGVILDVKSALAAGVKVIQLRDKESDGAIVFKQALAIRRLCNHALFIINDRVDIALAVKADGVHLGQSDLPYEAARKMLGNRSIIGVTVHNIKEAASADTEGADYLGVSPIFATTTKSDAGTPQGVELIKKIKKISALPIVAIGGINLNNAPLVIAAGADAICAISAVGSGEGVKKEIKNFQVLFYRKKGRCIV